jgi:hypothetical protein
LSNAAEPVASADPDAAKDLLPIIVPGSQRVTGTPRDAYLKIVTDYAERILRMATQEEWLYRGNKSKAQEFNTQHFVKAQLAVSKVDVTKRRTPWWRIAAEIAQPLLWLFGGLSLAQAIANNGWGWGVTFGIVCAIALGSLATIKILDYLENR